MKKFSKAPPSSGSKDGRLIGHLLRADPGKIKHVDLLPDQNSKGHVKFMLAGPTVVKVGSPSSGKRKRVGVNTQVANGLDIVNMYKKAGYGISGVTRDGVVIVEPAGKPDSFDMTQLNKALSKVGYKFSSE